MHTASHVYFVQQGEDGPIKIGLAKNVVARLDGLRASNPSELYVRAIVPGDHDLEAEIHLRFAKHHIRGEWFHPDLALLGYIASLPKAALRDLRLRRRYRTNRVPLEEARAIWADPELSSRHARELLVGWTSRRIAAELGVRPVNHQGRSSAANGAQGGRPVYKPTKAEETAAKLIWLDRKTYREWPDADKAIRKQVNKRFTAWRAHALWGGREPPAR